MDPNQIPNRFQYRDPRDSSSPSSQTPFSFPSNQSAGVDPQILNQHFSMYGVPYPYTSPEQYLNALSGTQAYRPPRQSEPEEEDPEIVPNTQPTQTTTRQRPGKEVGEGSSKTRLRVSWTTEEETCLATCWLRVRSEPGATDEADGIKRLWNPVRDLYNPQFPEKTRNADQLSSKWRSLSNVIHKWDVLFKQVTGSNPDMLGQNVLDLCESEYLRRYGRTFRNLNAWTVVRNTTPWAKEFGEDEATPTRPAPARRTRPVDSDPEDEANSGRKSARSNSSSDASSYRQLVMEQMARLDATCNNTSREQTFRAIQEEASARQRALDFEFLAKTGEGLPERARRLLEEEQERIYAKYSRR